jgi:cell wall assembly regulator SMI1
MHELWTRLEKWLAINDPDALKMLQPGATEAEIRAFEQAVSVQLPEDLRTSYRIHNGQSPEGDYLIYGREFLSLARIQEEWEVWKELLDDGSFQTKTGVDQGCNPDAGIRNVWWSAGWIPLTYDGCGNHDCVDLDPAEGGTVGQIISLWHDDADREMLAPSFRLWFTQYVEALESGALSIRED